LLSQEKYDHLLMFPFSRSVNTKIFCFAFYIGLCLLTSFTLTSAQALADAPSSEPILAIHLAPNGQDRANTLAFSPDGHLLAVGSSLGIYFYDSQTGQQVRFIPTQTWVRSLAFSPDGESLVTGSYDPLVRLWRVSDGCLLHEFMGHTAWVRSVAYSPDGGLLATASDDNTVRLWSVPDQAPLKTFTVGMDGVRAVAFSPDGKVLATGGFDNTVRLWGVWDGSLIRELVGHTGWVRTLSFSLNGEYLASGGFDATARLWRVSDGLLLDTLEGHSASVLGLSFSPDGQTLASASVDTTIRLWQVPDGTLMETLKGHKDFVFSVAFSPDGLMLASGEVDNAVYLWSMLNQAQSPSTKEVTGNSGQSSSSTCKECHHPFGDQPARVIEAECTVCHLNGALGLSWCPSFYRVPGPTTMSVNPAGIFDQSGVPHGNRSFGVEISSPGNGEYLYSRGDIIAAVPVKGKVYSASGNLTGVQVQLQIQSQGKQTVMGTTIPGTDGRFYFYVNLSETEQEMDLISTTRVQAPNENSCLRCHDKYYVANTGLSPGQYRLIVTATMLDGSKVFDERLVIVDHGQLIPLQVKVELAERNQTISNLPLTASTRLYEWRGRKFAGTTDAGGLATLQVEVLTEAPTRYTVQVEPVVVDGVLYESVEPVEITLPPGASHAPPITLRVRATHGRLSGWLIPSPASPVSISAIHLPDGATFRTQSSPQGIFTFPDLPIGRYLMAGNPDALASLGWAAQPQLVDLFEKPHTSLNLPLSPLSGALLSGAVRLPDGRFLPFAFVSLEGLTASRPILPASGRFSLAGLPSGIRTLLVSAPGFYSQARVVDPATTQPLDLDLVMRPETRLLVWGTGRVVVPPETALVEDRLHLTLQRGWLWGEGGTDSPLVLRVRRAEISIPAGEFAVENLPGATPWLYLFDGQAEITWDDGSEPIPLTEDQMVALPEDARPVPVPYDPVVVAALQHMNPIPISPTWQPSLQAQIRDRLASAGITIAQIVTFITYAMVFISIVSAPFVGIYWWRRSRPK
jgi:hypothetical protein